VIALVNLESSEDSSRAPEFAGQLTEAQSDVRSVDDQEDSWLIDRIRHDPPDSAALDELVSRHWKTLYGRCHLLALDQEKAKDLAQDAWCRVLRARHSLRPDGNFPAYLTTVATNLWRDSQRHARRAGAMADHRLASLDAALFDGEGETFVLADALPDLSATESEEAARLRLDIDEALGRLSPRLRDVLVARFITGESCAEIGRRYGRTEQSISGWVREAIREMKLHLEDQTSAGIGTQEG
jgi:RNA polymerase sigma-70 factor (ECF subfamily)